MALGSIISMGLRIFSTWFQRRNDPDTVRFFDLRKAKNATEYQKSQMDRALNNRDIDSLSRIINRL